MSDQDELSSADKHWANVYAERTRQREGHKLSAVARRQALIDGKATYIAAAPCKHGHEPVRDAASGKCVGCYSRDAIREQKEAARAAGPLEWAVANRKGLRYYFPVLNEAILYCQEAKQERPVHRGLFRVGLMGGHCMVCESKRSRNLRKARRKQPRPLWDD